MAVFNFCPDQYVPETIAPELGGTTMTTTTGWNMASRPASPYQRRFKLKLHGLRWFLDVDGKYDFTTEPLFNAHALERFYKEHMTWKPFDFTHQHIDGVISCRFFSAFSVPAGVANSGGHVDPLEVMLIEHNPSY